MKKLARIREVISKNILGRYVFNPEILQILLEIEYDGKNEIQVVDAFDKLMNQYQQKIYAVEFEVKDMT